MKSIFRRSLLLVLLLGWFALGAGLVYGNEAIQGLFVESYDGAFIPGAVRKPGGDGPFPAVLYIHGGLGGSGQEAAKRMLRGPVPEQFHQLGYVGFAADYRRYHFGQDEIQDVLAGYRKLQNLPYVDTTRVAVIGGSHGGYLAQMLVTRVTPAATVSFAGLSDIEGMFYETGRKLARSVEDWEAWRDRLVELKNARNDPAVAGREVERIPGGNSALRPGSAGYEVAFELGWRYRDRLLRPTAAARGSRLLDFRALVGRAPAQDQPLPRRQAFPGSRPRQQGRHADCEMDRRGFRRPQRGLEGAHPAGSREQGRAAGHRPGAAIAAVGLRRANGGHRRRGR